VNREETMTRLVLLPVATIGVLSIVVTAFAGDRPPRRASADARENVSERGEAVIRPPAPIPSSRGKQRAVTSPSSAERHAAEFLRWKDQHVPR
jgi:hypothetical protein